MDLELTLKQCSIFEKKKCYMIHKFLVLMCLTNDDLKHMTKLNYILISCLLCTVSTETEKMSIFITPIHNITM